VIVQAKEASAAGEVMLTVQRSGCTGAEPIPEPGTYAGDTTASGADTSTGCGMGDGPDQFWYFATCPGTTEVSLSTCEGVSFDSVMELRRGSCRGRAERCNDDGTGLGVVCTEPSGSRIDAPLVGEGLWFLIVDGYLAADHGPYRLDVAW
jgi:hypothetical protein